MIKEITLSVPKYVYKFLLSEPDYDHLGPGVILAPQKSEIGKLIVCMSKMIHYNQTFETPAKTKSNEILTIRYKCKKKAFDVPVDRYAALSAFFIEQFRASLIREVSAVHLLHGGWDYGWCVRSFLARRNIVVSDSLDKDMEWEAAKKIYRDHRQELDSKLLTSRKVSEPVLSGLGAFCPV
ncbi:hypothetical protein [Dyadobacter crusticola]|uniref:hypothetical protein n=1 Tax=Dyadobacter crusticola TaxID=292407 RepID=UPI0004E270C4|nr:hypothetical protein [Dyadobacter crusticola]